MDSVQIWCPGDRRFVILVDDIEGRFAPENENFELITLPELNIPGTPWLCFKYTVVELCTAVKPYALRHLLDLYGFESVLYLDPDMLLYRDVRDAFPPPGGASVVLTPHLTSPDTKFTHSELEVLRSGVFNLGFIAVSNCEETRRFLDWWCNRLGDWCRIDAEKGLFVDQRWVDLVPGMFTRVHILRCPSYNIAYWNLHQRPIRVRDGVYQINGKDLAIFHFSGYSPAMPEQISRYRKGERVCSVLSGLFEDYRRRLLEAGWEESSSWDYSYDRFDNGILIPEVVRRIGDEIPSIAESVGDPFSGNGFSTIQSRWNELVPLDTENGTGERVPRLARRILRSHLGSAGSVTEIRSFYQWLNTTGRRNLGLHNVFLAPVMTALFAPAERDVAWVPDVTSRLPSGPDSNVSSASDSDPQFHILRIAAAIYDAREDLRRHFEHRGGRNGLLYTDWLLTYGRCEYRLREAEIRALEELRRSRSRTAETTRFAGGNRLGSLAGKAYRRYLGSRGRREPPSTATRLRLIGRFDSDRLSWNVARRLADIGRRNGIDVTAANMDRDPINLGEAATSSLQFNVLIGSISDMASIFDRGNCSQGGAWVAYHTEGCAEFHGRHNGKLPSFAEIWVPSAFCRGLIQHETDAPVACLPPPLVHPAECARTRSSFGLPPERFVFLTLVDLRRSPKAQSALVAIEAFLEAFSSSEACLLKVVVRNAHQNLEALQHLIECSSSDNIVIETLEEPFQDTPSLLKAADCLVSFEWQRCFDLDLVEAMGLGTPVIVGQAAGGLDFISSDNAYTVKLTAWGQSAVVQPSVEIAARQMVSVMQDKELRQSRIASAKRVIAERFCDRTIGEELRKRANCIVNQTLSG